MESYEGRDGAAELEYAVYGLESVNVAKRADLVAVIGTKTALQSSSVLVQTLSDSFCSQVANIWGVSVKDAKAGDAGHSSKFTFVVDGQLKHFFLGVVPEPSTLSRHNANYAVNVISSLTSGASGCGKDGLLIYVSEHRHLFSIGCASARVFPIFSRKTTSPRKSAQFMMSLCSTDGGDVKSICDRVTSVAKSIREVGCMGDTPADIMNSQAFVAKANAVKAELEVLGKPVALNVFRMKELKAGGFGGIAGVGQGAAVAGPDREPALIHLSHIFGDVNAEDSRNYALCGKGIIFDTGGLSIKSRAGMCGMKVDMLGAATVLHAFKSAVETEAVKNGRLDSLLCVAENSVSAMAIRPDDILTMHSGRTVEINNTDAEGRLVLGDGVSYAAKSLSPDVIITAATLTGAQGVATGKRHCAVMASSDEAERTAVQAGKQSGDTCFPVLYAPELFKKEFSSKVADMYNSVKDRSNAQVSCAGQFIANHLPSDYVANGSHFVHLDMAAPSRTDGRSNGYGVALIVEFLSSFIPSKGRK